MVIILGGGGYMALRSAHKRNHMGRDAKKTSSIDNSADDIQE
jgi:hypothetical protein